MFFWVFFSEGYRECPVDSGQEGGEKYNVVHSYSQEYERGKISLQPILDKHACSIGQRNCVWLAEVFFLFFFFFFFLQIFKMYGFAKVVRDNGQRLISISGAKI